MQHAQVSDLTATGDTTKTLIGTITLPATARRIVGLWCYAVGAATLTSAECASGFVEYESPDLPLNPLQLPLDIVDILTSGAVGFNPRIVALDIPCKGQERIQGSVTMDMAQTGALKARFGVITD